MVGNVGNIESAKRFAEQLAAWDSRITRIAVIEEAERHGPGRKFRP